MELGVIGEAFRAVGRQPGRIGTVPGWIGEAPGWRSMPFPDGTRRFPVHAGPLPAGAERHPDGVGNLPDGVECGVSISLIILCQKSYKNTKTLNKISSFRSNLARLPFRYTGL